MDRLLSPSGRGVGGEGFRLMSVNQGKLDSLIAKAESDIEASQLRVGIKFLTTPDLWKVYAALPSGIKAKARKAYPLWKENQAHPPLHCK